MQRVKTSETKHMLGWSFLPCTTDTLEEVQLEGGGAGRGEGGAGSGEGGAERREGQGKKKRKWTGANLKCELTASLGKKLTSLSSSR